MSDEYIKIPATVPPAHEDAPTLYDVAARLLTIAEFSELQGFQHFRAECLEAIVSELVLALLDEVFPGMSNEEPNNNGN